LKDCGFIYDRWKNIYCELIVDGTLLRVSQDIICIFVVNCKTPPQIEMKTIEETYCHIKYMLLSIFYPINYLDIAVVSLQDNCLCSDLKSDQTNT